MKMVIHKWSRGAAIVACVALGNTLAVEAWAQTRSDMAAEQGSGVADQYKIGPGDTVRIAVYQSPDLSVEARVTENGTISYPLIGTFQISGLTVTEAEKSLASALKKGDFLRNPQITIQVVNVRANQVKVLGQVSNPGLVPLDMAGMRLTDVLAAVGGIAAGSGADTVVLTGTRDGQPVRYEIDVPQLFAPGGQSRDVVMQPGDTIWVDRFPTVFMYGEVQRPGEIRLERGMTVMQALASAGGLTQRGTLRGLRIGRRDATGKTVELELGLDDKLQAGDIVYIKESLF